jgi:two-component system sensor histidine kinase/response regulator
MIVDTLMSVFASPAEDVASAGVGKESVRYPGLRILLAEDNVINQQIAVELLQEVGATVDVANHGREAWEKLTAGAEGAYHLVLMDLQMPEMDGHQATMKIRSEPRFAKLPIIAMTAHATTEERQRCLDEGMNDHVSKPIDPELLYGTLGRFYPAPASAASAPRTPAPAPASSSDGLPEVDGLDTKDGLTRVAGNRVLYLKLLRQFAEQQAATPRQIAESLAADDRKLAERLAHTVKGVAGSLGARGIQQVAGDLEKAIASGARNPDLSRFEASLGDFVRRLRTALPAEASPAAPASSMDSAQLRVFVREMTSHLNNFDPAAGDLFGKHRESLRGFFSPEAFESIEKQIGAFSFADALATLQQAARQKGIAEP